MMKAVTKQQDIFQKHLITITIMVVRKEKAVTDLTSEDTLDYIYVSDAMYPRLSGQGCYQNTQQTISYKYHIKHETEEEVASLAMII